jgi:hypothetical protein
MIIERPAGLQRHLFGGDGLAALEIDHRNCRTAALGSHVASETSRNLKAFGVNEHAPLTKMGKNRSLIFTDLITAPFRAYAKSR